MAQHKAFGKPYTRRMRLFAILIFVFIGLTGAAAQDEQRRVTEDAALPTKRILDLSYDNIEIKDLLRDLADRYDINLIVPDTLYGHLSLHLRQVTWEQAFRVVLTPIGYGFSNEAGIVNVYKSKNTSEAPAKTEQEWQCLHTPLTHVTISGAIILLVLAVTARFIFAITVLLNQPRTPTQLAPRPIWALAVVLGGFIPLFVYWKIHYSKGVKHSESNEPNKSL